MFHGVLGIRTVTAAGLLSFWEPGWGVSMSLSFLYFFFSGSVMIWYDIWFRISGSEFVLQSIYPIRSYTTSSFYSMIPCHRYTSFLSLVSDWIADFLLSLSLSSTSHNSFFFTFSLLLRSLSQQTHPITLLSTFYILRIWGFNFVGFISTSLWCFLWSST